MHLPLGGCKEAALRIANRHGGERATPQAWQSPQTLSQRYQQGLNRPQPRSCAAGRGCWTRVQKFAGGCCSRLQPGASG
eukprot:353630-Chlamydomonas_euryale.AAC.2